MKDEMNRGRSQVIWRYTPGATFRFNDSAAWCITSEITLRNPSPLEGALAKAVHEALVRWKAIGLGAYPDPLQYANKYTVGEPFQVWYDIWPVVFTCQKCGQVHYYKDLNRLRTVNESLSCRTCKGRDMLRQISYGYVCECGHIDSISVQPHDPTHPILLADKGSFEESYWLCKVCGKPLYRSPRDALGYRSCTCTPGKFMRGTLLGDSRVYYSQTIDLVDIKSATLTEWVNNSRFSDLLLGSVLGVSAYDPRHLQDLANYRPSLGGLSFDLSAMREVLIQSGKTEEDAEALVRQAAIRASGDPWEDYEAELAPLRAMVGPYSWKDYARTVEYVFVRDEPSMAAISIEDLIREAAALGDHGSSRRLESERTLASQLGLINLRIVQALPVLLAAIGYTRYFASPYDSTASESNKNIRQAVLRAFPPQDQKLPIYAARNTTEAIFYELDPWRLAAFLEANTNLPLPRDAMVSTPALRAWLLSKFGRLVESGESHLLLRPFEQEMGIIVDEPSALAFGVLHTISHVLKATAHRYVGIDSDSLAEYLFPAHSAGLLYVSTHVEFTLGGMDSVFRTNLTQWLGSARDYAGRCSFDPVCARSGGACSACLYPKFGCAYFNRTVSRSFLFGGDVPGRSGRLEGFWSTTITNATAELRLRASR